MIRFQKVRALLIKGKKTELVLKTNFLLKNALLESRKKNLEILESIEYAKLIQQAILPKSRHFKRAFEKTFLIYEPKDIISGDFFWVSNSANFSYLALADCTGHGVPGAMLSVMGSSLLNYIIHSKSISQVHEVLNELDKKMIESFSTENIDLDYNNDWIDIGLVRYDIKSNKLSYSGAKLNLILVREGEIIEIKGDRFPVAGWQIEQNRKFTLKEIEIKKGDKIYMYTDGFCDQFGGPKGKKFGKRKLHELLILIQSNAFEDHKKTLTNALHYWMDYKMIKFDQIDDISLIGVQL